MVAPRPTERPSAKEISDLDMLSACSDYGYARGPYPSDVFADRFPPKVALAKLAKLRKRGWIDPKSYLTRNGREELRKLEEKA